MTTTIRRAGVAVALALLMATCLAGLARAANIIQCSPATDAYVICEGTDGPDVMYGTNEFDLVHAYEGADTVYGRAGNDDLNGGVGPDTVYGGPGDDKIDDGESDYWSGEDETTAAPETITFGETLCPKSTSEGEGMIRLATINRPSVRTHSIVAPVMTASFTTRG